MNVQRKKMGYQPVALPVDITNLLIKFVTLIDQAGGDHVLIDVVMPIGEVVSLRVSITGRVLPPMPKGEKFN
jgi:hypothetical protein